MAEEHTDPKAPLLQQLAILRRTEAEFIAGGIPEALQAALRAQIEGLETQLRAAGVDLSTAGGDVVLGDKNVTGDDVRGYKIARDQINIHAQVVQVSERLWRGLPFSGPLPDLRRATEEHLGSLLDRHRYLSLKGMGVADRVALRLPLLDIYVPLKARLEMPEGETWHRRLQLAGRQLVQSEGEEMIAMARLGEARPALELLQQHDGLVVLGDPGSGKTTFLRYLALKLALGEGDDLGLGQRLPVLVPLSAYANALDKEDVRLDDFVADYLHGIGSDLPMAEMLAEALRQGVALVLLDGLDEVQRLALRDTVVERVVDFYTFHRRAGNKFVLTSRIVGYRNVRPTAYGLGECTLVDFEEEDIRDFVTRWTIALEQQAQGSESAVVTLDAAQERQDLLDAIEGNPGVRRLAANPLLLTILALMKRQGVTLPERRVELYDQYVRTLLSTWNRARSLSGRAPGRELDVVQTLRLLAPLALWMHQVNPGAGLVKREALRRQLEALFAERGEADAEAAARQLLVDLREHAGLLLERGPGEFGFIHLTFEEYLAAVGIALLGQRDLAPVVNELAQHVSDPAWREVALLTVGYLGIVQQRDEAAGEVVEALAAQQPGPPGEAVVLAGEAVLNTGKGGVAASSREHVVQALTVAMQDAGVPTVLRRRAGLALGRLGWRFDDLDAFVEVPAGEFLYGDDKRKQRIPYRFWIGKYPVTNAQYAQFVQDAGYERQELWSEAGWAWRHGQDTDLAQIKDSGLRRTYENWLTRRPPELRAQPFWWDDLAWNNPLFPVVGVCWYEAEAYTRWLDRRLQTFLLVGGSQASRPKGYAVRLPDEVEWERAARGTDGREYPWGRGFDSAQTNATEGRSEGDGTTAVCTYPQGAGPSGAWDMAGNVWEWMRTRWSADEPLFVLRGGAWDAADPTRWTRCASRNRLISVNCLDDAGLRVVLSLPQ